MLKIILKYRKKIWVQPLLFFSVGFLPLSSYLFAPQMWRTNFSLLFWCIWLPVLFVGFGYMRSARVGATNVLFYLMALLVTAIKYPTETALSFEKQLPREFVGPFVIAVVAGLLATCNFKRD